MKFSFDRDLVFFDASSALSALRRTQSQGAWRVLSTQDKGLVDRMFPRVKMAVGEYLDGFSKYYLIFFNLNKKDQDIWTDLKITGPARIFPISAPPDSLYKAGEGFDLASGEDLIVPYKEFQLHFLGLAVGVGGGVHFNGSN